MDRVDLAEMRQCSVLWLNTICQLNSGINAIWFFIIDNYDTVWRCVSLISVSVYFHLELFSSNAMLFWCAKEVGYQLIALTGCTICIYSACSQELIISVNGYGSGDRGGWALHAWRVSNGYSKRASENLAKCSQKSPEGRVVDVRLAKRVLTKLWAVIYDAKHSGLEPLQRKSTPLEV